MTVPALADEYSAAVDSRLVCGLTGGADLLVAREARMRIGPALAPAVQVQRVVGPGAPAVGHHRVARLVGESAGVDEGFYSGGYWPGRYEWVYPDGHGAGAWGAHHRALLWIRGRLLVVLDNMIADRSAPADFVESNWQFSEGSLALDPGARRAGTLHDDANVLALFPLVPEGTVMSLHEGQTDPPRGWLAGERGYVPAPQLCLSVESEPGWLDFATVFVPYRGKEAPDISASVRSGRCWELAIEWADGSSDLVYWTGRLARALGDLPGIETDAGLVHIRRPADGRAAGGLVVDGIYLEPLTSERRPSPAVFAIGEGDEAPR